MAKQHMKFGIDVPVTVLKAEKLDVINTNDF